MKPIGFFLSLAIALFSVNCASAQYGGIRVNAIVFTTATINEGYEFATGEQYSYDISVHWKPISTNRLPKRVFCIQPSFRYWLRPYYTGHFFAAHPAFAIMNEKDDIHNNKGGLTGIGISYGYCWILSTRWNLTAEVGPGVYYLKERKSYHHTDPMSDEIITHRHRIMLLPSKLDLSVTYLF